MHAFCQIPFSGFFIIRKQAALMKNRSLKKARERKFSFKFEAG